MHAGATLAAAAVLVVADELTGITAPFERLLFLLDRGPLQAGVYAGVALALAGASVLLLRGRSKWLSASAALLFASATATELGFDRFTNSGFSEDWIAISMREIGMAPAALSTYWDGTMALIAVGTLAFWGVVLLAVRRTSLFGPLLPTRVWLAVLVGVVAFSGLWRMRFDHYRAFPANLRAAAGITDYYRLQLSLPDRVDPTVRLVDRPLVSKRIVFVVDESVRPDYLSLNGYHRRTTPYLESIAPRLINLGTAVSGSTCSDTSNQILNSDIRPEDVGQREAILTSPTIFRYAKKAGFRTVLLSGVFRSPLFYGIRKSDLEDIDETVLVNLRYDTPKHQNDVHVADELARVFERYPDEPVFVYLRKQGTHFPFDDYVPKTAQPFEPVLAGLRPMSDHPRELLNSYLNGIRWNLDDFYRRLDEVLGDQEALLIYTSDHGEDVELAGGGLLHCGEHPSMARVPLWIDTRTPALRERLLSRYGPDFIEQNRDRVSHLDVFPTLLSLMNIRTRHPTLFGDLGDDPRIYHPPGVHGTLRTLVFDNDR